MKEVTGSEVLVRTDVLWPQKKQVRRRRRPNEGLIIASGGVFRVVRDSEMKTIGLVTLYKYSSTCACVCRGRPRASSCQAAGAMRVLCGCLCLGTLLVLWFFEKFCFFANPTNRLPSWNMLQHTSHGKRV